MVSNTSKTLIHTALLCEAQPLIQYLKLFKNKEFPNIYENDQYVLIVSGIGKIATQMALELIFKTYKIHKALNIGIAGCKEETISIGTLCCTTHILNNIRYETLITHDKPLENKEQLSTTLVDMEANYFLKKCEAFLDKEKIYCLKVVSDYLSREIPKKQFVTDLIQKNIPLIKEIL